MTRFFRALDAFNAWVERHLLAGSADAYMRRDPQGRHRRPDREARR